MFDPIECKGCYEECERRTDKPSLELCLHCARTPDDVDCCRCENCGWNCENELGMPDAPVKYSDERPHWEYGYCGGVNWTETWTCRDCGHVWSFENGNV